MLNLLLLLFVHRDVLTHLCGYTHYAAAIDYSSVSMGTAEG